LSKTSSEYPPDDKALFSRVKLLVVIGVTVFMFLKSFITILSLSS